MFFFKLSYAKLAAFSDILAPLIESFSLGLRTNSCASSFIQGIKSCIPLLSLSGVSPKNSFLLYEAFVTPVVLNSMLLLDAGYPF